MQYLSVFFASNAQLNDGNGGNQRIYRRFHLLRRTRHTFSCFMASWHLAFQCVHCAALIPMTEFIYFNAAPHRISLCQIYWRIFDSFLCVSCSLSLSLYRPRSAPLHSARLGHMTEWPVNSFLFLRLETCRFYGETRLSCYTNAVRPLKWINERPTTLAEGM